MSGFTYGNGIVHSMTQNARQLPARSLDSYVSGGITTKVLDDTFSYDANGNVLSLVDASNAPTADNRTWGVDPLLPTLYDGLDRLKQVKSANQWGLASYSYDPLDNLRTNQLGATTLTYSYDAGNRLSSLTNGLGSYWSITTDGRGNITANALKAQAYQFDLAHRMNAVTGKESYLYDGHGRRARTLNLQTGTIEYYGYGKDGRLLQDWSNRRQVRNGYVYLGNTVVGLYEVNLTNGTVTPKYQHTDALGSPVVTTNASKTALSRMSYTPYGLPTLPMDGVGYTGHFMDVGTQLTYMQQRYYDPQMGRFLSTDPVTVSDGDNRHFNRYSYGYGNPYKFTDPDGRCPMCLAVFAFVTLMSHSDPANAPDIGERPQRTSSGEALQAVANALPAGRLVTGLRSGLGAGNGLSQRAANREARRQAGVPTSQQATSQHNGRANDGTPVGRQQTYEVPKPGGGTQTVSVQVSRDTRGKHEGMPQIEAGKTKPGGQTDEAGRPRLQNEGKVRVDFVP